MGIPGFITVKDVAARIGLTNKRVYQLIDEKKLEAVRPGREYLVKAKSVEKYLRARDESKTDTKKQSAKNGSKKKR